MRSGGPGGRQGRGKGLCLSGQGLQPGSSGAHPRIGARSPTPRCWRRWSGQTCRLAASASAPRVLAPRCCSAALLLLWVGRHFLAGGAGLAKARTARAAAGPQQRAPHAGRSSVSEPLGTQFKARGTFSTRVQASSRTPALVGLPQRQQAVAAYPLRSPGSRASSLGPPLRPRCGSPHVACLLSARATHGLRAAAHRHARGQGDMLTRATGLPSMPTSLAAAAAACRLLLPPAAPAPHQRPASMPLSCCSYIARHHVQAPRLAVHAGCRWRRLR